MFFIVFSGILIGPLAKLNGFHTSIKTHAYEYDAYEYDFSAYNKLYIKLRTQVVLCPR